jgi:hypothetical protein
VGQPSITVTSPNGGEIWKQGEAHNITWSSIGLPSDATVYITLSNYSSCTATVCNPPAGQTITASVPVNQGSYTWTVNSASGIGNQFMINVWSRQNKIAMMM